MLKHILGPLFSAIIALACMSAFLVVFLFLGFVLGY